MIQIYFSTLIIKLRSQEIFSKLTGTPAYSAYLIEPLQLKSDSANKIQNMLLLGTTSYSAYLLVFSWNYIDVLFNVNFDLDLKVTKEISCSDIDVIVTLNLGWIVKDGSPSPSLGTIYEAYY